MHLRLRLRPHPKWELTALARLLTRFKGAASQGMERGGEKEGTRKAAWALAGMGRGHLPSLKMLSNVL